MPGAAGYLASATAADPPRHAPAPAGLAQPATAPEALPARKTTIVLPTYNEAQNLPGMIVVLLALEPPVHVLVVDDNSPDGTGELAERLARANPGRVEVLHRTAKTGLGDAYLAGFRHALERGAERIFEMDADFSHPVGAVLPMLKLAETSDVVVGSRYVKGGSLDQRWSPLRRWISQGGNLYARFVTGLRVHDTTAGFKCFRREALERIPLHEVRSQGYNFQIEMALRCQRAGLRVVEYPIHFRERDAGVSKMTPGIALEALWRLWQLRFLVR
ncbi:MAG TPA: polyprenol monophosphomannose synthase [Chloroflexota bacterium]|nr:polyprenol monophosphomannose synthase [Chloroflexota bacterium]